MTDPLLEAICASPDDDAPRLVWADREGGERGEFVVIQCRLAQKDIPREERWRLVRREKELLEKNQHAWAPDERVLPRFVRGFIQFASIQQRHLIENADELVLELPLLTEIGLSAHARGARDESAEMAWNAIAGALGPALARFPLEGFYGDATVTDFAPDEHDYANRLIDLVVRAAPNLRVIQISGSPSLLGLGNITLLPNLEALYLEGQENLAFELIPGLIRVLPNLKRLAIRASGEIRTFVNAPEAHQLTQLTLGRRVSSSDVENIAVLANLTRLALHSDDPFPSAAFEKHERLEELTLHAAIDDRDLELFARAPFASRLRHLTLSRSRLTDAAIPILLSFPRLELLWVQGGSMRSLDALRPVIPDVHGD